MGDSLDSGSDSAARWFARGAAHAVSVPGALLASAFVGFAALTREAGLPLEMVLFMTVAVWALPAQVVLVGAMISGNALPAAAIAVSLSSVRLMPMVVALVPEMRTQRTRKWVLYALSHFVAVTSWVLAMEHFRSVPRERRTAFYAGIAMTLVIGVSLVTALVYTAAATLPPAVAAAMFFLTPMYFLVSLWRSARERASHYAMAFGIVLGPLLHVAMPGFELILAGVLGGGAAYAIHWLARRDGATP